MNVSDYRDAVIVFVSVLIFYAAIGGLHRALSHATPVNLVVHLCWQGPDRGVFEPSKGPHSKDCKR